jgi:hypothetical protein
MGVEQDRSRKKLDNWASIVVLIIVISFGATIFVKNWHFGVIFFVILFFLTIGIKKSWFKDKIFHD